MFVYSRYLCGGTLVPWYIVISVTLNSYCLPRQHVRANKASHQTLSVSSSCTPPTTMSRPATAQTKFEIIFFQIVTEIKGSLNILISRGPTIKNKRVQPSSY